MAWLAYGKDLDGGRLFLYDEMVIMFIGGVFSSVINAFLSYWNQMNSKVGSGVDLVDCSICSLLENDVLDDCLLRLVSYLCK